MEIDLVAFAKNKKNRKKELGNVNNICFYFFYKCVCKPHTHDLFEHLLWTGWWFHGGSEWRGHVTGRRRVAEAAVRVTCRLRVTAYRHEVGMVEQLHRLDGAVTVFQHRLLSLEERQMHWDKKLQTSKRLLQETINTSFLINTT